MDPGATDLWPLDVSFNDLAFPSFSNAAPQSPGYIPNRVQVPFGSQWFTMLWPNMPWFRFQSIIEISLYDNHAHPQSSSSHSLNGLEMEEERQIVSVLASSELSLDEALASRKLSSFFEQVIPERFDGEVRQKLQQPLDTSGGSRTVQLAELFLGLISNNAMPEEGVRLFLDSMVKYNQKGLLRRIFDIDTPTVQAVSTKILDTVAENGDKSALDFLLDAGIDRSNLTGAKGGRLLQIAVHAGGTEVAKVLVQNGADVNPKLEKFDETFDETFELPPLHHAVYENELALVSYLLEAGAQVDGFADSIAGTALSYAVQLGRLECVSLLLNAGANVDTCEVPYDRVEVIHFVDPFYLDALDYAYLACSSEVYGLLLPCSKKAKTSATIHGVLCAATEGVQKLKAYLKDRPRAVGRRRKVILEEALVHSHYFSGHEEAIDTLLDFEVDPNVPTYEIDEESPLLYAIPKGVSHVERLLEAGANINSKRVIRTAASKIGSLEVLNLLIEKGANLDLFGDGALEIAVIHKNLSAVKLLRESGVDLNKRRDMIHMAARWGSREIMEYFLRYHVDPNVPPDVSGFTALHYAANKPSFDVVKLLVDRDAEIITQSERRAKVTLLEVCAESGRGTSSLSQEAQEIFKFLLERGASIKGPRPGRRPLRWHSVLSSLIKGSAEYELILRVLNKGADVNEAGNGFGACTPIQAAAAAGNLDLVKMLLKRGADINAPATFCYGRTALQAACGEKEVNMELVTFLLDEGAEVNAKAGVEGGATALQGAAIQGHVKLADLLLGRHADVNAPPAIKMGRTALEGAAEHGRLDMVQLLLNAGVECERGGYDDAVELAVQNGHWAVVDLLRESSDGVSPQNI